MATPSTGFDPFAGVGLGLSLYSSLTDPTAGQQFEYGMMTESQKVKSAELQNKLLGEQEVWLKRVSGERQKMATDIYGREAKSLVDRLNLSVRNLATQYESGVAKSGFAYSGTLAEKYGRAREEEELSYLHGKQSLYDQYKTSLMNLQQNEEKGLTDITNQKRMLGLEKQQSYERANQYISDINPLD